MRCPFSGTNAQGDMPECNGECGVLMRREDTDQYRMCAFALIARERSGKEWIPANYRNEVD